MQELQEKATLDIAAAEKKATEAAEKKAALLIEATEKKAAADEAALQQEIRQLKKASNQTPLAPDVGFHVVRYLWMLTWPWPFSSCLPGPGGKIPGHCQLCGISNRTEPETRMRTFFSVRRG